MVYSTVLKNEITPIFFDSVIHQNRNATDNTISKNPANVEAHEWHSQYYM